MSNWHDGITKELALYLESLKVKGGQAIEALQEQIDIEAEAIRAELEKTAPNKNQRGSLAKALSKVKVTKKLNWYGYSLTFEGNAKNGEPYQKIANILNYGSSTIQGTRFISRAIRNLKGMDERIAQRWANKTRRD